MAVNWRIKTFIEILSTDAIINKEKTKRISRLYASDSFGMYYSRCILTGTVFRLCACNNVGERVNFRCHMLSLVAAVLAPLSLQLRAQEITYRHIKPTAQRNV